MTECEGEFAQQLPAGAAVLLPGLDLPCEPPAALVESTPRSVSKASRSRSAALSAKNSAARTS
ncbi:MAG: hypothetical protein ACKPB0_19730, partial [Opitutaceae bacterium]